LVADTVTADRQPAAPRLVSRNALLGVLRAAGPGSIVLVCAQAGSGKTELLRSWAESEDLAGHVAWVCVERG